MMNIEVRDAGKKGHGVFAVSDIAKGTVIERCPLIVLSSADCKKIDPTEL